ncbi:MAG: phosphotransferase [Alphaproteobacteria bacterium]|nr:phosphotransferase [Alphaproteobacteria bacterium]
MSDREALIGTFLRKCGWGGVRRSKLAGDASFRHYDRLARPGGHRAVLMDAPPPKEDVRPFVAIARHLESLGFSAPRILGVDEANGLLLLEDLGDNTYTKLLSRAGHDEYALYGLAVDVLAALHGSRGAVPDGLAAYDDDRLMAEAMLLPDWYMPEMGRAVDEAARAEYAALWRDTFPLARLMPDTLVLRDFHVDNLILLPRDGVAACGLLDFQDAVVGPLTYDLMSLMEDARRDIDPGLVSAMRTRYLDAVPGLDPMAFEVSWAVLAAQRHAKVIGIFSRLCRRDGKSAYLTHIPRVWRLFEAALAHPALEGVRGWVDRHMPPAERGVPTP